MTKTTKVLWFSRHKMSEAQINDLKNKLGGNLIITQVNGTAPNVHVGFEGKQPEEGGVDADFVLTGDIAPLKELVKEFDEVAAVLPIGMQEQILPFLPSKRLLTALSNRVVDDNGKAGFVHAKWEKITEIKVVKTDL